MRPVPAARLLRDVAVAAALVAGVCIGGAAGAQSKSGKGAKPAQGTSAEASPQRRQQLQSEQRQLQQRLARLKQQLADSEANHSEAADALRESEAAISATNRRLRELAETRRRVERQVANLQDRGRSVGLRQSEQEQQLGRLLRAEQRLGRLAPWQQWLGGESPAALARDRRYLDVAARARARSVGDLRERREEIDQLEAESLLKQAELAGIAQEENRARTQLLREQSARRQTLAKLSRQIGAQRQTIASLERDEQRLGALVEQIARLLAEQARRAAAAAARSNARASAPAAAEAADVETASRKIAALRGTLRLPVQGDVTARFGAARKTEAGVDAPTWKGIFIRAPQGTEVRAIAAGRVVFADWLRGFGNLLILDHGEGLLSVYGNNESLLRTVGDRIEREEVIAAVGNTGGNTESGLYFELRLQGRPIDPLKWAQAR